MITNPLDDSDAPPVPSASLSAGKNSAAEQGLNIPMAWKPTAAEPIPVVRCTANNASGERCKKWSLRGATVCIRHGAQLPSVKEHAQALVEASRMRMIGLADDAIDAIEDLVTNPGTQQNVRLKAATEILDRIGVKGAPDLTVVVEHTASPSDLIAEKLKAMATRLQPKPIEPEDLGEVEEDVVDEEGPDVVS